MEDTGVLRPPAVDSTGVTGILRLTPPADSKEKLRESICASSTTSGIDVVVASDVITLLPVAANGLLLLLIILVVV